MKSQLSKHEKAETMSENSLVNKSLSVRNQQQEQHTRMSQDQNIMEQQLGQLEGMVDQLTREKQSSLSSGFFLPCH